MHGLLLAAVEAGCPKVDPAKYIMGHVADGYEFELPGGACGWTGQHDLHDILGHWMLGGYDITPTKLAMNAMLAAVILLVVMLLAVRNRGPVPKGKLQTTVEMLYVFVRDELAVKNIPHHPEKYVPYLATCFFFILTMNVLGLIPWLAPATSTVYLTFVLAAATFIMTQIAGMRSQGVAGYWMHLVPNGVPVLLYPLMLPIEFIGLFTKPFALMMRLFANMLAGHLVMFFLIGLIFFLGSAWVGAVAIPFTIAIFFLEIFVAFLQAYVFTILSAVFIGIASAGH